MKAPALLSIALLATLASCNGPAPRPPAGPRGYSLDSAPGDARYGQEQPAPTDTRYLDTGDPATTPPPGPNDPAAATVQPPNPNAPVTPDTVNVTPPAPGTTTPPANGTTAPVPPVTAPPTTTTKPATPTPATNSYPTATRTKAGFVKSPFDPLGREIDVREMRSGQKARCPYTQKVFLVP